MRKSGLKVNINPHIIYDEIQKSSDVAVKDVADKILLDTKEYVPKKTKKLRDSLQVKEPFTKNEIVLSYYRRLYLPQYGVNRDISEEIYEGINPVTGNPIHDWTTPGTGDHWDEMAMDEHLDKWIAYFADQTRKIWAERKRRQRSKKK